MVKYQDFPSNKEIIKAATEGVALMFAGSLLRGTPVFSAENIQLGLAAGASFLVIDYFAEDFSRSVRFGAGFRTGYGP